MHGFIQTANHAHNQRRSRPLKHLGILAIISLLFLSCVSGKSTYLPGYSEIAPAPSYGTIREYNNNLSRLYNDDPLYNSAIRLIPENREALLWRLALIDSAVSSIDIQVLLWDMDSTGTLLIQRLVEAANRGVRVRILVDDFFNTKPDRTMALLSSHPNLEIRIFNPNPDRLTKTGFAIRFLLEMDRLNRRMHNKLIIADSQAVIIGGRNISDKYFGFCADYNFVDLDALVWGEPVSDMIISFNKFYNSRYAISGSDLFRRTPRGSFLDLYQDKLEQIKSDPLLQHQDFQSRNWQPFFNKNIKTYHAAEVSYVSDHPYNHDDRRVVPGIKDIMQLKGNDMIVVTPYFLPGDEVFETLTAIRQKRERLRLIVPSLASINHTAVHSHYRKYRRPVLESGIELFEYNYQPDAAGRSFADSEPQKAGFISLHMKAVAMNHHMSYVGTLNFDHRALRINTENGIFVDSRDFSRELRNIMYRMMRPEESWQITLENGRINWINGHETRSRAPARSGFQRIQEFLYRLLPIEEQL